MDRRAFLTNMLHGTLAAMLTPEIMPQLLMHQYATRPLIDLEPEEIARITAIGIGQFGASCTRLLAYNTTNITCHDVIFDSTECANTSDLNNLFKSIRGSDLLFLLTSYDDPYCEAIFTACFETAASVGVLTVGAVPQSYNAKSTSLASSAIFTLFQPSLNCTSKHLNQCMQLTNHAVLQLVKSVSAIFNNQGYIGIDFADVTRILKSGNRGWLGVGTASGVQKERVAVSLALEDLDRQDIDPNKCSGFLVCLHTSSELSLEEVETLINDFWAFFSSGTDFLFNYSTEVLAGSSDRVAIMAMT